MGDEMCAQSIIVSVVVLRREPLGDISNILHQGVEALLESEDYLGHLLAHRHLS